MPKLTLPGAWQACADAFLADVEARSGSWQSRDKYAHQLRLFFADPGKSPAEYTRKEVDAFLRHGSFARSNHDAPVGVSARNGRLTALRSFYAYAANYDTGGESLLPGTWPTRGFRYLRVEAHYRAMNASELQRFFAVIPDTKAGARDRALFLVLWWTARRSSEIARLKWGDIEAAMIVDEEGQAHEGYVYRYVGKGHSREVRTKELPRPAYEAIVAYLQRVGRLTTIRPQDAIFRAVYPGHGKFPEAHVSQPTINLRFRLYRDAAGLVDARKLTVHSLRHSAALIRRQSGATLEQIKEILDHSSLAVSDRYLQVQVGQSDPMAALLSAKFATLGAMG